MAIISDDAQAARFEFHRILTAQLKVLFETDRAYRVVKEKNLPQDLAQKLITGLADGTASKDGIGVMNTCAALGINCTYKAIQLYLNEGKKY